MMVNPVEKLVEYVLSASKLGKDPKDKWSIFWRGTKNFRARFNLSNYSPQKLYSINTIYGSFHFRDNFGDITNLIDIFFHEVYRVRRLPHQGVILDVGANIGLAAAWFAHHNPGKTIYCFEPLRDNARLINLNCPRAIVQPFAVGAKQSLISLSVDRDNVMASYVPYRWGTKEVEFEVISLDEFALKEDLERVALIKIDTEGMENQILEGSRETLRKTQQIVLESHGQSNHYQAIERLQTLGFNIDSEQFLKTTGLVFASLREIAHQ